MSAQGRVYDRGLGGERRLELLRALALATMEEAGIARIIAPDFTITLRASAPSLRVTDEQAMRFVERARQAYTSQAAEKAGPAASLPAP